MVTREQVRMARAALDWSMRELAEKAGVAMNTVNRYENGADALGENLLKIRRALEAGGVVFIDENGGGVGVRIKKSVR
jgi:transcriptional regulator with XRE-family HTH domain